jgi:trehalose-6-phosphatase
MPARSTTVPATAFVADGEFLFQDDVEELRGSPWMLGLNGSDVLPFYLGDDITDEDAFGTPRGRGVGIIVGRLDEPEVAGRSTAADLALASVEEVRRFLDAMAR